MQAGSHRCQPLPENGEVSLHFVGLQLHVARHFTPLQRICCFGLDGMRKSARSISPITQIGELIDWSSSWADLRGQGKRRDKTGWELRMKESYREGLASRSGPESYAGGGNIAGVATAGVRAGQPLSSEITHLACRPRPDKGKATSTLALLASRRRTRRSLRTWACAETSIARTGRSWELPWGAVRPHQRGTVGERHRR
jgi:hypothetical protein